jgi:ABC-2 type transport system ATP-binding protein
MTTMTQQGAVPLIELSQVSKSYPIGHIVQKRRPALTGLTLTVGGPEIFGYLGANGSGKTTTIKILMGLIAPDSGLACLFGRDVADPGSRARAGFLPEHPYFYDYLTPREYLDYAGRLFGVKRGECRERAGRLLERLGLLAVADTALRRFSKGMLQRFGIAQALINDPQLVLLDEPMSGLDPMGRRLVRDLMLELREAGKTIFFSTHILSDAEAICDRVALLKGGRLTSVGRLDEILAIDVENMEVLTSGLALSVLSALSGEGRTIVAAGERVRVTLPEAGLAALIQQVEREGGRILGVQPNRQSLEDYFMQEVGRTNREGRWEVVD